MIAIKYTLFAIISTLFNLLFQYFSFFIYGGFGNLYLAMFIGTLAGLVCKYILDKKYIFYHIPKGKVDDAKKFIRYTLTGVLTTGIFWGTEIGFDAFFGSGSAQYVNAVNGFSSESAKYIGAVIGLSIGYIIKYFLDKKYVFKRQYS